MRGLEHRVKRAANPEEFEVSAFRALGFDFVAEGLIFRLDRIVAHFPERHNESANLVKKNPQALASLPPVVGAKLGILRGNDAQLRASGKQPRADVIRAAG